MRVYSYDANGDTAARTTGELLPPRIVSQPISQVVEQGQVATFSVLVADSRGASFQWKLDGTDIPATGDSLVLPNISASDAGHYSVVIANSLGSVTSESATLTVGNNGDLDSGPPLFRLVAYSDAGGTVTVSPMKLGYELGETVTLTATPGAPSVFIGWAGDLAVGDLVSSTNPVSVVMTSDRTVRGRFASAVAPPSGMVAFWRGEADATDLIEGHDGAFFRGAAAAGPSITRFGKVRGAFFFDGTVHVRVPHSDLLTPAQVTAEAWVFPTVLSSSDQTVIARGSPTNEDDAWWLGVLSGKPRFWSKHAGQGMLLLEAPSTIPLDSWTHLAITFDGTTKCLYVNGVQVASQRGLAALFYEAAPVPVTIGSDWGFNASSARFTGFVDEVALYNRALTINEVFDIYNADSTGKDVSSPYFTSPSPLPDVAPGAACSQQLSTVLGVPHVAFSVSRGALPPGMTLSTSGLLSGASDTSGTFDFTISATDAAGRSAEQLYVLTVLQSVALPADLVAWWRGEPTSGGTVPDTLEGHDGGFFSGSGPADGTYVPTGKVGGAFVFDGTVHIQVPDAPELQPNEMTAEAWVFPAIASGGEQTIIARGSATNDDRGYSLSLFQGTPRFWSKHVGAGLLRLDAPTAIPLGEWTHLAASLDGATKRLYINGTQVVSQQVPGVVIYEPQGPPLTIGARWGRGAPADLFTGRLDEVSFYRRALSPDEIANIAHASSAGKNARGPYMDSPSELPAAVVGQAFSHTFTSVLGSAPVTFALPASSSSLPAGLALSPAGALSGTPSSTGQFPLDVLATDAEGASSRQRCMLQVFQSVSLPPGVIGWWRGEGDATDSLGTNHGAVQNGVVFLQGNVGQAFALDGSTGFVDIPDAPALRLSSLTLEAWVAFDRISGIAVVVAKPVGTGTSDSYALWLQNGTLDGAVGDAVGIGSVISTSFSPTPGSWHHVAYTFDDAAKQQALYIDAVQTAGSASKSIGYDSQPVLLGRDTENGVATFFLQGRIDEVTIYDRTLSPAEIASIYDAGPAGKQVR